MAKFKYVGKRTKANGKVDVKVPTRGGKFLEFKDVEPNVTVIDVGDNSFAARCLEYAVDVDKKKIYEKVQ